MITKTKLKEQNVKTETMLVSNLPKMQPKIYKMPSNKIKTSSYRALSIEINSEK